MAKKFMGFKPETMTNKILPALGYNGPSDQKSINAFLAASPAAAAKMGKYTMAARQMVEGRPINAASGMTVGKAGNIVSNIVNQAKSTNSPFAGKTAAKIHSQAAIRGGASPGDDRAPGSAYAQNNPASYATANPSVVVYGPDGTMYGSPAAAVNAGVTNFTTTDLLFPLLKVVLQMQMVQLH